MVRVSGQLAEVEATRQEQAAYGRSEVFGPLLETLTIRPADNGLKGSELKNVHIARENVAAYLRFVGGISDSRIDNAKLCVSEIVTNAIKDGGPDGLTHINIFTSLGAFVIAVGSGRPKKGSLPQVKETVPDDAESGRGLLLVDCSSDQWGFMAINPSRAPDGTATETWVVIKRDELAEANLVPLVPAPAMGIDTLG
ncbi:MAG TPA: ATP-binding protein [Candidatus Saccharimonadales bacterium]|jgi:anti-sigma regulatory factor (Ser/Thr protein kinase)